MHKGYAETPKGQVHYVTEGEGDPLILLHQNPRSSREFFHLIPFLSKHFKVFALDSLGCGHSDPLPTGTTIAALAENVLEVMDYLGLDSSYFFGCHTGSVVATELAAQSPSHVRALVVMGYTMTERGSERESAHEWAVNKTTKLLEFSGDGSHLMKHWSWAYGQLVSHWAHIQNLPTSDLPSNALQFLELALLDLAQSRRSAPDIYRAVFSYDWQPRLPLVQAPTLLIEVDGHTEPDFCRRVDQAKSIMLKGSTLKMDQSDHNAAEWKSEELARVIIEFLHNPD